MPFWLSRAGVPLAQIALVLAATMQPLAWKLIWIPLLDLGSNRRAWYIAMAIGTAALLVCTSLVSSPARHLGLYTALLTAMAVTATTGHAALYALMATTVRARDQGKAAGFGMAANLGGTGALGALALWLGDHVSVSIAGVVLGAVTLACGGCGLVVSEPRLSNAGRCAGVAARSIVGAFRETMFDLWRTLRSRNGFTGALICLAPVGCGALTNLFPALARHYGAEVHVVQLVNGIGGGIVSALGALVGGFLADRMSRRMAYGLAGGLTALSAVAMLLSPPDPWTYAWGTLSYSFANGIAFATWAGMVLEVVGRTAGVATKYALFNAAASFAISYVTALDGKIPAWLGWSEMRGALATDAALTFLGIAFLGAMLLVLRPAAPTAPLAVTGSPAP
jgi:MFS family permease